MVHRLLAPRVAESLSKSGQSMFFPLINFLSPTTSSSWTRSSFPSQLSWVHLQTKSRSVYQRLLVSSTLAHPFRFPSAAHCVSAGIVPAGQPLHPHTVLATATQASLQRRRRPILFPPRPSVAYGVLAAPRQHRWDVFDCEACTGSPDALGCVCVSGLMPTHPTRVFSFLSFCLSMGWSDGQICFVRLVMGHLMAK